MGQGYRAYAVQLTNPYHLVTVIEYLSGQSDDLMQKVMHIANGEYYISDKGEESWDKYKKIFICPTQLKLREESLGALVLFDVRHSAIKPILDFDVDSNRSIKNMIALKFCSNQPLHIRICHKHYHIRQCNMFTILTMLLKNMKCRSTTLS